MGGTPLVVTPDIAYDSVHDQYLVVHGHGYIQGLLTNNAGAVLKVLTVNASAAVTGSYAQTPRIAFSPDASGGTGGYLVTWHETVGAIAQVRGRIVATDGTPLGTDFVIATDAAAPGTGSMWTQGAAVAYSSASREFLVAWMGYYTTTNDIFFNRVSADGAVLQATPTRVTAGTGDWERDPSVTYNPDANEFYIAYAGFWDAKGYSYVSGARVQAGTGAILAMSPEFTATVATYVPAVAYNTATKQYTVSWYHRTRVGASMYGINVGADGTAASAVRILSGYYQAYDANDLKYNAVSGDMLMTTHGANPQAWEDACISIKSDGLPYDNGFICTSTTDVRALVPNPASSDGNYNPRLAVNTSNNQWLLVTSSIFKSVNAQFVASQATGGPGTPPNPSPTPTPVAPVPTPLMSLDAPGANASVSSSGFTIGGWAIDKGTTSGTGVDAIHVWAYPSGGAAPLFVGQANYGASRPDVGAAFGSQFASSGFQLIGQLSPGTYDLAVFAHSTVTGTFSNMKTAHITVTAPLSVPRMAVDLPAQNQTISQNITVAGWALDVASAFGSGVDAVHVWAYPAGGGSPVWVGEASYGSSRPDVASVLGATRFANTGFALQSTLARGDYTLVVFAHSTVTGTFNNAQMVTIHVQ